MNNKSEAQVYLEQVERLDARIKNKLIEKQQWKDIALGITANMDGERVQSSGSKNKLGNAVERCVDIETEIDNLIDNLIETKKDVIRTIEAVYNPTWYRLLHAKYIQFKGLSEIADDFNKNYEWAKCNHKRALAVVQKLLNERKF